MPDIYGVVSAVDQALPVRKVKLNIGRSSQMNNPLKETMGPSEVVARLIAEVDRVAASNFSVIIVGETGSGKEVVARAIYEASHCAQGTFIPVDCGAIPETLLESELFGHEKGAFTGAESLKLGKFEIANGGTLLLDEISNMPLGSQAKLLRALQEKKIYRLGGTKAVSVDVRLLAATAHNLQDLTESGSFRQDLFFRLNEFTIMIPPLRERKDDIHYLAKRFLDQGNVELQKSVQGFSESALNKLIQYKWPGNVRQLRSVIRRAVLMADELITDEHVEFGNVNVSKTPFTPKLPQEWKNLSLKEIISAVEREVLSEVLRKTGGNKSKAARYLQVDNKTIHDKVKRLGIEVRPEGEPAHCVINTIFGALGYE